MCALAGCLCAPKIHPRCVAALRKFCLKRNLLPKNKCKAITIRVANRVARLQFVGAMATPCHYRNLRLKLSGWGEWSFGWKFFADSSIQAIPFILSPCFHIVINFVFILIKNRYQYHFEIHSGPSATKHVTVSQINHSPFRMCSI